MGGRVFGYNLSKGVLSINEEEAVTVRLIYQKYLNEGKGQLAIAKELLATNVPTGGYFKKWSKQAVSRVLTSEKYVGDLKSKKHHTPEYLDHKSARSNEEDTIYFHDHHDAIIGRDTWNQVQEEIQRRNSLSKKNTHYSNRYWASGKVECGECGKCCVSRTKYNQDGTSIRFWYCKEAYTYGKKNNAHDKSCWGCNSSLINDFALLECTRFALETIAINKDLLFKKVCEKLDSVCTGSDEDNELILINNKIEKAKVKKSCSD